MVRKKIFAVFGGFLAVMLVFTVLSRAVSGASMAKVETVRIKTGTIDHKVTGSGKVEAGREVAVYTESGQRVKEICVKEGQTVEEGELLFTIDMEELEEQILAAQQEMEKARLQNQDAQNAKDLEQRNRAAAQNRAADDYHQAVSDGDSSVAQAKAAWDSAEQALQEFLQTKPNIVGSISGGEVRGVSTGSEFSLCTADAMAPAASLDSLANGGFCFYGNSAIGKAGKSPEAGQPGKDENSQSPGENKSGADKEDGSGENEAGKESGSGENEAKKESGSGKSEAKKEGGSGENEAGKEGGSGKSEPGKESGSGENGAGKKGGSGENEPGAGTEDSSGEDHLGTEDGSGENQLGAEDGSGENQPGAEGNQGAEEGDSQNPEADMAAWEAQKAQLEQAAAEAKAAYEAALASRADNVKAAARALEDASVPAAADSTTKQNEITRKQQELALQKLQALKEAEGKILAPVRGVVTQIAVTTGDFTTEGTAMRLSDTSQGSRLVASVGKDNEKYISRGSRVNISVFGSKDKISDYTVTDVAENEEDPELLDVVVDLPEGVLEAGARAEIELVQKSQNYGSVIPIQALREEQNGYYVLVLEEEQGVMGKEQVARRFEVKIQDKNSTYAALEDGLLTGEQEIISSSSRTISDGSRVRKKEE